MRSTDPRETPQIADDDTLLRRFHRSAYRNGIVGRRAFMYDDEPQQNLSVDLAKLTTPQECRSRAGKPGFGVGELSVAYVRSEEIGFEVFHKPENDNWAHCELSGENTLIKCQLLAEHLAVCLVPD